MTGLLHAHTTILCHVRVDYMWTTVLEIMLYVQLLHEAGTILLHVQVKHTWTALMDNNALW